MRKKSRSGAGMASRMLVAGTIFLEFGFFGIIFGEGGLILVFSSGVASFDALRMGVLLTFPRKWLRVGAVVSEWRS